MKEEDVIKEIMKDIQEKRIIGSKKKGELTGTKT